MASPDGEGAGAGAVCCMCGDHGLPGELVRCRRCRVRLQHRYCSDLYPRAAAYRRCNWCLRELADQGGRAGQAASAVASKPEEKRKAASSVSASDEERQRGQRHHEGCSSRRSPAEPGHPVKKKLKAEDKMPPPSPTAGAGKGITTETSGSKEVMRAGKTRLGRVRVQRYKLLAEVISC
ncbi:hypothetical protein BAE44_0016460 [Dichanthelium oligosanthes]|uniref:PHD-type zinc finger plants domain-containing protein n=1 Tax=Dichanthelium oligosanthes TaxID=888268 RepID=A0A1E5VBN9_9POAL|nr:hypothetical protein BAE44_0016460 [Dichanthelium oligosanthes]